MPLLRGAIPTPRHQLAASIPFQTRPGIPASWGVLPKTLQMWGNGEYGDCVTAEECAAIAAYSTMLGVPTVLIPDSACTSWARQHGYLNGADLTSVMQDMASDGISSGGVTYRDGHPTSVNYSDNANLSSAIYTGPVKVGIAANQLERAGAGSKMGWIGTGFHRDGNEDHCVGYWGFGTAQQLADLMHNTLGISVSLGNLAPGSPSYYLYTWKTVGIIDQQSTDNVVGEAWVRTPSVIPTPPWTVPTPTPTPTPTPPPGPSPSSGTLIIDLGSRTILAPGFTLVPSPGDSPLDLTPIPLPPDS